MDHNRDNDQSFDGEFLDIHEAYEMDYWSKRFGCTTSQLAAAAKAGGGSVKAASKCMDNE